MKKYKDSKSKMRYDNYWEYENNYWRQYFALQKVKCTVEDEKTRDKVYQHFMTKAYRVMDVLYLSPSMKAELADYLVKEFRLEHKYGLWV